MNIAHYETGLVYLDPTDDELVELSKTRWDTIRILEGKDFVAIANGFGHTHTTIARALMNLDKRGKKPYTVPLILFHERGIAYMNLMDIGQGEQVKFWDAMGYLEDHTCKVLRELITLSRLRMQ